MRPLQHLALLLIVLAISGCHGRPLHVVTDSRVSMDEADGDPVVPMQVAAGDCNGPTVAIIDVDGLLLNDNMTGLFSNGENPVAIFREKLERVSRHPQYCAVLLRINSPGGGVTATDIMRSDLMRFKAHTNLPVIACLMDLGTGGAYYLATAADHIIAHPTTVTGGIGVILNLYNLQDTMAQANIQGVPIKAGQHTDLGTPITTMDEEAREILQQVADEFHIRFRDTVRRSRSVPVEAEAKVFDGRIFTAPQATELGMVDSIGYVDDALEIARQYGNCPHAAAVILHRPRDPANTIYAVTPNTPLQGAMFPLNVPGLERSRLPTFLYLWQPEPTMERLSGK